MKRTFSTLCLSTMLLWTGVTTVSLSVLSCTSFAAPALNFQNILQQERTWAGLQTKK